jgi:hypothetical protein
VGYLARSVVTESLLGRAKLLTSLVELTKWVPDQKPVLFLPVYSYGMHGLPYSARAIEWSGG